jgi:hypothetical protein
MIELERRLQRLEKPYETGVVWITWDGAKEDMPEGVITNAIVLPGRVPVGTPVDPPITHWRAGGMQVKRSKKDT